MHTETKQKFDLCLLAKEMRQSGAFENDICKDDYVEDANLQQFYVEIVDELMNSYCFEPELTTTKILKLI